MNIKFHDRYIIDHGVYCYIKTYAMYAYVQPGILYFVNILLNTY